MTLAPSSHQWLTSVPATDAAEAHHVPDVRVAVLAHPLADRRRLQARRAGHVEGVAVGVGRRAHRSSPPGSRRRSSTESTGSRTAAPASTRWRAGRRRRRGSRGRTGAGCRGSAGTPPPCRRASGPTPPRRTGCPGVPFGLSCAMLLSADAAELVADPDEGELGDVGGAPRSCTPRRSSRAASSASPAPPMTSRKKYGSGRPSAASVGVDPARGCRRAPPAGCAWPRRSGIPPRRAGASAIR